MRFREWLLRESKAEEAAEDVARTFVTGGDIDAVFDKIAALHGLSSEEEAQAVNLVKGMISSGRIVLRKAVQPKPVEEEPEPVLTQAQESKYGRGECHYLTAAMLRLRPSGEAWGLYNDDNLIHSVFKPPGSEAFLDAFGVMKNTAELEARRHDFLFADGAKWQRMDAEELWKVTSLDRSRRMRQAAGPAKKLLQAADKAERRK